MKKILFVVPILSGIGGIETSLLNLIKNIDTNNYSIDLCVYGNYIAYKDRIPEFVRIIPGTKEMEYCYVSYRNLKVHLKFFEKIYLLLIKSIKKLFGIRMVLNLVKKKYKFEHYDIAVSFANDAIIDGTFVGGGNQIIDECTDAPIKLGWIHNEPYRCGLDKNYYERIYRNYTYVVNVSKTCKEMFDKIVPQLEKKSKYVYNTFDIERIKTKSKEFSSGFNSKKFNILTVSRIDNNQKRIDRAIEACKIIINSGISSFHWTLIGDGPDYDEFKALCFNKGLEPYMTFMGKLANPYPYIRDADILVQPSDYEAYSMVLQEALILNTPLIVTNYPSAVEAVQNGKNGFIVEKDPYDIASKIIELMNNRIELNKLNDYIIDNPFSNQLAINQFYSLLR